MKAKYIEFEGDVEEIKEVAAHLFGHVADPSGGSSGSPAAEVTPELVLAVLRRGPLSENARRMLKIVAAAQPPGISTVELAKQMGVSDRVLAGVHSAFVRRMEGTPGWPEGKYIFAWDPADESSYWMSEPAAEALKSFPL